MIAARKIIEAENTGDNQFEYCMSGALSYVFDEIIEATNDINKIIYQEG